MTGANDSVLICCVAVSSAPLMSFSGFSTAGSFSTPVNVPITFLSLSSRSCGSNAWTPWLITAIACSIAVRAGAKSWLSWLTSWALKPSMADWTSSVRALRFRASRSERTKRTAAIITD